MRLENKVAIVTGAASGFGAAIARAYAREGAKVVLADLNGDGAGVVAREIGAGALALRVDVTEPADVRRMVEAAEAQFGRLDILVNNAGFTHVNQPMLEVDEATFDRVYAVNVKALYYAAQVVVPVFRRLGGGVMLNVCSTAGIRPRPGLTWYNGSKAAAIILSKSMAVELAPDRIRVNALCPVMGETAMLERFMGMPDTPENRKRFLATIPLGRLCRPEDVAHAAVYLASDEAEFITGVAFEIDGGRCV